MPVLLVLLATPAVLLAGGAASTSAQSEALIEIFLNGELPVLCRAKNAGHEKQAPACHQKVLLGAHAQLKTNVGQVKKTVRKTRCILAAATTTSTTTTTTTTTRTAASTTAALKKAERKSAECFLGSLTFWGGGFVGTKAPRKE